jgi:hypothetical protein
MIHRAGNDRLARPSVDREVTRAALTRQHWDRGMLSDEVGGCWSSPSVDRGKRSPTGVACPVKHGCLAFTH